MVSEKSSSPAIRGRASPTQPLLAGIQTPMSWSHPGLQNFQKCKWPKPFWFLPPTTSSRAERSHLRHTPSRFQQRIGAFSVPAVKCWNRLPPLLVMTLSVSVFKNTVRTLMARNLSCCTTSLICFSIFIGSPGYLCFFYPKIIYVHMVITGPSGQSYHT